MLTFVLNVQLEMNDFVQVTALQINSTICSDIWGKYHE